VTAMQLSGELDIVRERSRDCPNDALAPATLSVPEASVYLISDGEIRFAPFLATLPLLRFHTIFDVDSKFWSEAI
jgi:hypothetical protein